MGNRIKAWNLLARVMFIVVFAASLGVFYFTRSGNGWSDLIINLVFAVIAALFLIGYFAGCARPLARMAAALDRVTQQLEESDEDRKTLWARYSQNTAPFNNRRLDERWCAYLRETRRLQKQNALTVDCRIEDYINEELMYTAVNKPFCDQLSGIMSGLGILFTFIGLVYGLRNFDATTVDVMQSSTQALMAGIKIAFLTSIFGLIYSLLLGLVYKKLLRDSLGVLYDFQDTYTEAVRPANEHAAENAMLRLQMEQNAALQKFGTAVGEQCSQAIITLMNPTVQELKRTITQYVSVAIEDQRAGMDRVVRYFLDGMNNSLGNVFGQLKNRTEELASWEKDMIESISSLTTGIGSTYQDLAEAQANTHRIAATMASYTSAIEALTASQRSVVEDMQRLMDSYQRLHQQEETYIRSIASAAESAMKNSQSSRKATEAVAAIAAGIQTSNTESARQITTAGQLMAQSAESIRVMTQNVAADISAAAERLDRAASELDSSLAHTVGDSLAMMDDGISRLTNCLSNVTTAMNSVSGTVRSLPKTVSGMDADVKSTAKSIDTELKLLLRAVTDAQKSMSRFTAELDRRM